MSLLIGSSRNGWLAVVLACSLLLGYTTLFAGRAGASADDAFLHPGMLYTQEDLQLMKDKVEKRQSPWLPEWRLMQSNKLAQPTYTNTFYETVYRNDAVNGNKGNSDLQNSSSAALILAVEWSVTGDPVYAKAALRILNGWAGSLKSIQGHDAQLAASLYGYKLLNAAEIMRYSNSGWKKEEMSQFTSMMMNVFYPLTKTYGYVNGGWANGNWDAAGCSV
ncbi:alginate lyase family protein [Paenibacillus sp. P26]|nr:alginate lyase family protein [Paenibacillus sp. P26]